MKQLKDIKNFIILFLIFTQMSCNRRENEFISLDHMTFTNSYDKNSIKISYYILIDGPSSEDFLKKEIIEYSQKNAQKKMILTKNNIASLNFVFYKKTKNTSYFIKNDESPGGFSSEEISHYQEDFIANYYIEKCLEGTREKLYLHTIPEEIIVNNCRD